MFGSGHQKTRDNAPTFHNHHPTGKKKLHVIYLDGRMYIFDTDKIKPISRIVTKTHSTSKVFEKKFGDDFINSRSGLGSYHQLYEE